MGENMSERGKIIGAVFCEKEEEDYIIVQKVLDNAKEEGADVIEFRYDTKEGTCKLNSALYHTVLETISTCMTKEEGGFFDGTPEEWANLLKETVDCGTDYISIGLEIAKTEQGKSVMEYAKQKNVKVIVGEHKQEMPSIKEILDSLDASENVGTDIAKFAAMAENPEEVEILKEAALYDLGIPKIMIAMGPHGSDFRIDCLKPPYNCWGSFGAIGKATAPGQRRIKEMKKNLDSEK